MIGLSSKEVFGNKKSIHIAEVLEMVVVMAIGAGEREIDMVKVRLASLGFTPHVVIGSERTVVAALGKGTFPDLAHLEEMPMVEKVYRISQPFKLVGREVKSEDSTVTVGGVRIGGGSKGRFHVIAGPCAVESEEQILETARFVKRAGATLLRGGAFKPRTSPYSFQGLGELGLKLLAAAGRETGLPVVTEVVNTKDIELVAEYADVIQIGARNMQNYALLQEVGRTRRPVILKRGLSATIEEWLMAAEYIMSEGNENVILCERGIRTYEPSTRNTLDLAAVPLVKELSHLPVIVDPSHGTGKRSLIPVMSRAAIIAGADGLMIEVHPAPDKAFSDGPQSLDFKAFAELMEGIRPIAEVMGRGVAESELYA